MTSTICSLYYNIKGTDDWSTIRRNLPQVRLNSHSTITPVCFTTTLEQTFANSSKEVISEARYTFPLYDGVAVSKYTITYGETTLRGTVQQKDVAKKTYDAAVERGETAGLLQSLPAGTFGVTIGNIPPQTDVHVDIVYCGELKHDAAIDGLRYVLPTSIAPRYGTYPGEMMESTANSNSGISITVDVDMDQSAIRKLQSPSHPVSVSMGATSVDDTKGAFAPSKASVSLALGTTELDGDFVLQLLIDDISKPQFLVEKHPDLPNRAVMATLVPKFNLKTSLPEIVFVADQSGSMRGPKNDALVSALKVFIKSLPFGVRFNICAFGSSYKFLWPQSQAYNEANMKAAIDFVDTLSASYGGTELLKPVKAAFENKLGDMPLEVMLLTDGEIWGEQELFGFINTQITTNGTNARVFALGIGKDVSHTLVEGVARAGNGFAQFVAQEEETDQKVVRMLKGALYPHLTNRTLEVHYEKKEKTTGTPGGDDFELVEKVDYCLNLEEPRSDQSETASTGGKPKAISFFDESADLEKGIQPENADRYAHLPKFDVPKILQAPSEVPSLFPFNRTTIYLLLGPNAPQERISSMTIRATCPQGPLELTIEASGTEFVGSTVHQLAARKAVQELEEGRGWLQSAKTSSGSLIKEEHKSRFDELVEREAVRLGETFQVAGRWTSFVAVQADGSSSADDQTTQNEKSQPSARRKFRMAGFGGPPPTGQYGAFMSTSSRYAPGGPPPPAPAFGGSRARGLMSLVSHAPAARMQPSMHSEQRFMSASPPGMQQQSASRGGNRGGPGKDRYAPAAPAPASQMQQRPVFGAAAASQLAQATGFSLASEGQNSYQKEMQAAAQMPISNDVECEESDEDMGYALFDDDDDNGGAAAAAPPASTAPPKHPIHGLIGLQTFSGAWKWNDELFAIIRTKGAKPDLDSTFGSEEVMATALAVAYLELKWMASKPVWDLVVSKAKTWMGTQAGADAVDGLVEKAKSLF